MSQSEPECTVTCHSNDHATRVVNAVTARPKTDRLQAFFRHLCHNFPLLSDHFGRSVLHMAASCGDHRLTTWLLSNCQMSRDIEVKDAESAWTPLHRACFYGQIACIKALLVFGASVHALDRLHVTPLDLLVMDRPRYQRHYRRSDSKEVFFWGENDNFSLGINKKKTLLPEMLKKKKNEEIIDVILQKFHSLLLTQEGRVLSCGHGLNGRLLNGSEDLQMTFEPIKGLPRESRVEAIASGPDHVVLLVRHAREKSPQVYTCGSNTYHVLGHVPHVEKLLTPKAVIMKTKVSIEGVRGQRFHSLFFTRDQIFVFGTNLGQLAIERAQKRFITPHVVSALDLKGSDKHFEHVVCSEGAIVVLTSGGDILALHEFQCRKVAKGMTSVERIAVIGGTLDDRELIGVRETGSELRIAVMLKNSHVFLWKASDPTLARCLVRSGRELSFQDFYLNQSHVLLVTNSGEVFKGPIGDRKRKNIEHVDKGGKQVKGAFIKFIERDECHVIHARRVPHVHRAVAIFSDLSGRNFAALQSSPKVGMLEVVQEEIEDNCISRDLMFEEEFETDFVLKAFGRVKRVHKMILINGSEYFYKKLSQNPRIEEMNVESLITSWEALDQTLRFIYSNSCPLLSDGSVLRWNKKNKDPIKEVTETARKLGVTWLHKHLVRCVKVTGNKVKVIERGISPPKMAFERRDLFSDITIRSEDNVEFRCHKCLLMARLEYFRSMFSSQWRETGSDVTLPLQSRVLEVLLDHVYSDVTAVDQSEDAEFICRVLVSADQYLIPALKTRCESALVNLMSLKNCCELLELSYIYRADQLKRCSMDFILLNLVSLVEDNQQLNVLSDETLEELTQKYRLRARIESLMQTSSPLILVSIQIPIRSITRYSSAPSSDIFEESFTLLGPSLDFRFQRTSGSKHPKRVRKRTESSSSLEDNQRSPEKPEVKTGSDLKEEEIVEKETFKEKTPSGGIKWGQNSNLARNLNFKDILREEEMKSHVISVQKEKFNRQPIRAQHKSHVVLESPPTRGNPWLKVGVTQTESDVIDMKAILLDEAQELRARVTKPLHVIASEDRAIEELSALYNTCEEWVRVQRVSARVAEPVWHRR